MTTSHRENDYVSDHAQPDTPEKLRTPFQLLKDKITEAFAGTPFGSSHDPAKRDRLIQMGRVGIALPIIKDITFGTAPEVKEPDYEPAREFVADAERHNLEEIGMKEFTLLFEDGKRFEHKFGFKLPIFQLFQSIAQGAAHGHSMEDLLAIHKRAEPQVTEVELSLGYFLTQEWGTQKDLALDISTNILDMLYYENIDMNEDELEQFTEIIRNVFYVFPLAAMVVPLHFVSGATSESIKLICGQHSLGCHLRENRNTPLEEEKITITHMHDKVEQTKVAFHEVLHTCIYGNVLESRLISNYEYVDKAAFIDFIHTVFLLCEDFLEAYAVTPSDQIGFPFERMHDEFKEASKMVLSLKKVFEANDTSIAVDFAVDPILFDKNFASDFNEVLRKSIQLTLQNEKIGEVPIKSFTLSNEFLQLLCKGLFHDLLHPPLQFSNPEFNPAGISARVVRARQIFFEKLLPIFSCGKLSETTPLNLLREQLEIAAEGEPDIKSYGFTEILTHKYQENSKYPRTKIYLSPPQADSTNQRHLYIEYQTGPNPGTEVQSYILIVPPELHHIELNKSSIKISADNEKNELDISLSDTQFVQLKINEHGVTEIISKGTSEVQKIYVRSAIYQEDMSTAHYGEYSSDFAVNRLSGDQRIKDAKVFAYKFPTYRIKSFFVPNGQFAAVEIEDKGILTNLEQEYAVIPIYTGSNIEWQLVFSADLEHFEGIGWIDLKMALQKYGLQLPRILKPEQVISDADYFSLETMILHNNIVHHLQINDGVHSSVYSVIPV